MNQTNRDIGTLLEFERDYAARSDMTIEDLRGCGRYPAFCDCTEPDCTGFQMLHLRDEPDLAAAYLALLNAAREEWELGQQMADALADTLRPTERP